MSADWSPSPETLPGVLADVARLAGVPAALKLAEVWGGLRRHIPREVGPDHELSRILGHRVAQLVAPAIGGDAVKIPSLARERRAMAARSLWRDGYSQPQIARRLGIGVQQVQRLVGGLPRGNGGPPIDKQNVQACPYCGRKPGGASRTTSKHLDGRQLMLPLPE